MGFRRCNCPHSGLQRQQGHGSQAKRPDADQSDLDSLPPWSEFSPILPEQDPAPTGAAPILVAGAFIQGKSYKDGTCSLLPLNFDKRAPINVSIPAIQSADNFRTVDTVDPAHVAAPGVGRARNWMYERPLVGAHPVHGLRDTLADVRSTK
jgi:hypothetical protein